MPFLEHWVDLLEPALAHSAHIADTHARHVAMERDCVRLSLENLMTFPFVAERVNTGTLAQQAAHNANAKHQHEFLDPATGEFAPVD